jgi:uncharacterized protein YuzE
MTGSRTLQVTFAKPWRGTENAPPSTLRTMRVSVNRQKNVAYIELTNYGDSDVARYHDVVQPDIGGEFRFDLDKSGRLLGIEVRFAAQGLPQDLLEAAEPTDRLDPR